MSSEIRPDSKITDPASTKSHPKGLAMWDEKKRQSSTVAMILTLSAAAGMAILLVLLVFGYRQRTANNPYEDAQMVALKSQLELQPKDENLIQTFRERDQSLRQAYFYNKNFMRIGGWLLFGVCVILVVAARLTAWTTETPPTPDLDNSGDTTWKKRGTAQVALFVCGVGFLVGMIYLGIRQRVTPLGGDAPTTEIAMNVPQNNAVASNTIPPFETQPSPNTASATTANLPSPTVASDHKVEETNSTDNVDNAENKENINTTDNAAIPEGTTIASQVPSVEEFTANWAAFRGSMGTGTSAYENIPVTWSAETGENIRWKSEIPKEGNSSPIVWRDKIFITGADETVRQLFAYSTEDGKHLWTAEMAANVFGPDDHKPQMGTGFASPTAVTDGQHVAAIFAGGEMFCTDNDGNLLWNKNFGIPKSGYGYASSLTIFEHLAIVLIDQGVDSDVKSGQPLSRLYGIELATGNVVWETVREVPASWASPIVANIANTPQIITIAIPGIIAYDPHTGQELWRATGVRGDVGPTPTWFDTMVYGVPNDHSSLLAVDATGTGDVTNDNILWTTDESLPAISSPIATQDFLLTLTDGGTLACNDRADGTFLWYRDLDSPEVNASPSAVGKYLYLCTKDGNTWILEPTRDGCLRLDGTVTDEADLIANPDGTIGEELSASPAFQNGRIYLRGAQNLYCIENPSSASVENP